MWQFERINRIDYQELTDKWYALVTLSNDGAEESFFLKFADVPSKKLIMVEAEHLVQVKNAVLEGGATPEEIASADRYKAGV